MSRKTVLKSPCRKSTRHDYLTPDDFIQLLLKHIGRNEFDLDVCCTLPNIPAKNRFTINDNAFNHDWKGLCWMNPPCGDMLQKFCLRMLDNVKRNNAEFWALLPSRFPDYYVKEFSLNRGIMSVQGLMRQASFIYVIPEWKFQFGLPDGKCNGLAKSSWWLCHFGKNGNEARYAFRHHDPFKGTKYEGVLLCPLS